MVAPARTMSPAVGTWLATVVPVAPGTGNAATRKPTLAASVRASPRLMPTNFGQGNVCGPFDTESVTADPKGACVPGLGSAPSTAPTGAVSEKRSTTFHVNPADA